jgi:hypothetical protein
MEREAGSEAGGGVMFRNASKEELHVLLPDNQVYGFAIAQLLESRFEHTCCMVGNQIQAKGFDKSKPQCIEYWGESLPFLIVPELSDWHIKVFIDPSQDFYKQNVQLIRACKPMKFANEVIVDFEARDLTLRALLYLLEQPKSQWDILFNCFERNDEQSAEFYFKSDEVNAEALP